MGFSYSNSSLIAYNPGSNVVTADNGQAVFPPQSVWCQAGTPGETDNFADFRFTVPVGSGGNYYSLEAGAWPSIVGPLAGAYEFHVALNGTELFGEALGSAQYAAYTNTLLLSDGDVLDFLVGRGTNATGAGAQPFVLASLAMVSPSNSGYQPMILGQPQSQTVNTGQVVSLSAAAFGSVPLTYQWYTGAPWGQSAAIAGATNASHSSGAVTGTNTFWVLARNAFGVAESATATVAVVPNIYPKLGVVMVSGLPSLTLNGISGDAYRIQYCTNLSGPDWMTLIGFTLSGPSLTITDSQATGSTRFYRAVSP